MLPCAAGSSCFITDSIRIITQSRNLLKRTTGQAPARSRKLENIHLGHRYACGILHAAHVQPAVAEMVMQIDSGTELLRKTVGRLAHARGARQWPMQASNTC